MVCKKASLLLNVNTLVGKKSHRFNLHIYQTWILSKKIGSKRSLLPETGAHKFCYTPGRIATAYSIDIT